jgi:hypothetical protein
VQVFVAGTDRRTTTDAQGRFAFPNVPAGGYEVVAYQPGYAPAREALQKDVPPSSCASRPGAPRGYAQARPACRLVPSNYFPPQ